MTRIRRLVLILGGAVAAAAIAAGPAGAAPKGHPNGFLLLTINGATTQLPPGQAVKQANLACAGVAGAVPATVDAVRAAFPAPFTVCPGVTLLSRVAATDTEVEA